MHADDWPAILDLVVQYGYTYDANDAEGFVVMGIYREGKPKHTQRDCIHASSRGQIEERDI